MVLPPAPQAQQIRIPAVLIKRADQACEIDGNIGLRRRGRDALVTLLPAAYDPANPGDASAKDFRLFRSELEAKQDRGCLVLFGAREILDSVARSLHLPTHTAQNLRFSSYRDSGYVDLEPGMALRSVTPLLKSGGYVLPKHASVERGSTTDIRAGDEFRGMETAYFAVAQYDNGWLWSRCPSSVESTGKPNPQKNQLPDSWTLCRKAPGTFESYFLPAPVMPITIWPSSLQLAATSSNKRLCAFKRRRMRSAAPQVM